jgi:hypothetical protein
MITPKQSSDLILLERLRNSPSFGAIRATIQVDRDEFAREAEGYEEASPANQRRYWQGDERQRTNDMTLLLELLGSRDV